MSLPSRWSVQQRRPSIATRDLSIAWKLSTLIISPSNFLARAGRPRSARGGGERRGRKIRNWTRKKRVARAEKFRWLPAGSFRGSNFQKSFSGNDLPEEDPWRTLPTRNVVQINLKRSDLNCTVALRPLPPYIGKRSNEIVEIRTDI